MPRPFKFEFNQIVQVDHPLTSGKPCRIEARTQYASGDMPNEYLVEYVGDRGIPYFEKFGESLITAASDATTKLESN